MISITRYLTIPTYQEFLESFLKPNQPVILGPNLVQAWPAFSLWIKSKLSNGTNTPKYVDLDHLSEHYGDQEVSVTDCNTLDSLGNPQCTTYLFRDVVDKWRQEKGSSLYVKDWHLARTVEGNGSRTASGAFYTTPDIFQDDWMNAYYSAHTSDDFRFVYIGPEGTFTPLHRDVYSSYSWSTNVFGRKKWWLFPPEQTPYLFMKERNICIHDVRHVDEAVFPNFGKASPLVVVQEEGETIFVPSGWYHQVENLTTCLSINHNWCNSVNLPSLYSSMCEKVVEVENALEDVRSLLKEGASHRPDANDMGEWKKEFAIIVQDVVKQDAGWNWLTFWSMVLHALEAIASQEQQPPDSHRGSRGISYALNNALFLPAESKLRPAVSFILPRIESCITDFKKRDRYEDQGAVGEAVEKIVQLLHAISEVGSLQDV